MKIFTFTWDVPTDGYQLVTARIGSLDCRLLTNDVPRGSSYQVRQTKPLDLSALFLELAHVSDDAGILGFANRHGCLGLPARTAWYERGEHVIHGELASDWLQQAKRLRHCLSLWESQDIDGVAYMITESLDGNVSPRCLAGRQPRVMFEPQHLLGALWLQFAQAVEGRKVYRRCQGPGCGKWIAISLDEDGRSERAFHCGGPCRQKAYRGRRRHDETAGSAS